MRRSLLLVLVLLLLAAVLPAAAQWETVTTNNVNPANTSQSQYFGPSKTSGIEITTGGELKQSYAHTDGFVFLPAAEACTSNAPTTFIPTRVAASDWALARTSATAGGEQIIIHCNLNSWLQRAGQTKGVKMTSLRIAHQITVASLSWATWGKVSTRAFANNTANDIGPDLATAPTLPTTTQTNPYLTSVTLGNTSFPASPSALYQPANTNVALDLEFSVYIPNTGVYRLYGIGVNFSRLDH